MKRAGEAGFCEGIRVGMTLPIALDGLEAHGLDTPKGGEIMMDLIVFIGELDLVLYDIRPPINTKKLLA